MREYTTQSSTGWVQDWPAVASGGLSDATKVASKLTGDAVPRSPGSSACTSNGDLNPKGSITKPIRRRSRGSKRTTTHVTASITNFRAVVQQFTGCQSADSSYKGPITLKFGEGSEENYSDMDLSVPIHSFYSHCNQKTRAHLEHQQLHHVEGHQQLHDVEQEHGSTDSRDASDHLLSTFGNPTTYEMNINDIQAENLPFDDYAFIEEDFIFC